MNGHAVRRNPHAPSPARSGVLLAAATNAALIAANSPAAATYERLHLSLGPLTVAHWANEGLMAGFFLLDGLEIKREFLVGSLTDWSSRILPGGAAIVRMTVPASIYLAVAGGDPSARGRWAIPAATDIVVALAVLATLGPRVTPALRSFLLTVAVVDDLLAIAIIGLFYTAHIDGGMFAAAAGAAALLLALNRAGVRTLAPYCSSARLCGSPFSDRASTRRWREWPSRWRSPRALPSRSHSSGSSGRWRRSSTTASLRCSASSMPGSRLRT